MAVDKFGYKFLYPSKEGGWFYQQSADITDDAQFHPEGVSNSSGNQWTLTTSGPTSPDIAKNPSIFSGNAIGGCKMSFSDTEARGYAYKQDDPRDIEFKMAVKFRSSSSDNGFSISCTSGSHSGSGCCSGFSYMCTLEYNQNPTPFRFRKEMWHVSYHTDPKTGDGWTDSHFNFKFMGHGYIGLCFVRYNKKDGVSSGKDSVIIEMWGNPDPDDDPLNWILMKRTEDKGGWGNDGDKCGGNKDQIGTWACSKFRIKSNDSKLVADIKNVSIREIDPTKDFGDTPDAPEEPDQPQTTNTVTGTFKFKRNINVVRTSDCAASGFSSFFDSTGSEEDQELWNTDTEFIDRVGQRVRNTSSVLYGKIIKQFDVELRKQGSPGATPTITAKIRDADDHLKYTSSTTFAPNSLNTTFENKTFDFSDNTHTMQIGDRVYVEWATAEADPDVDYVVVAKREHTAVIEGGLTVFDTDLDTWSNKSTDMCCILYS